VAQQGAPAKVKRPLGPPRTTAYNGERAPTGSKPRGGGQADGRGLD